MEFFVENWIWFLVIGIVLLMTLIGYLAEKTDFGRRDVPKKEKMKKKEKNVEELKTDNKEVKPEVQMTLADDSILEETKDSGKIEILNNYEKTNDLAKELKVPFGYTSVDENERLFDKTDKKPNFIEEIIAEEPSEELVLDDVDNYEMELPDLESVVPDELLGDDDDDVWKF